jgi:methylated-DNA-[protein]-cysteine S-methyltransferase
VLRQELKYLTFQYDAMSSVIVMIEVYVEEEDGLWFGVAYEGEKVYATWFGRNEKQTLQGLTGNLPKAASYQQTSKPSAFGKRVVTAIKDVESGKDFSSRFKLATERLPVYTARVLEAAYAIPTGYVASYGGIAKAVGGGARAVGNIMAGNRFAPIVPCHRVVASDFGLGGYAGGFKEGKEIPVKGGKLQIFPVERVLQKAEKR